MRKQLRQQPCAKHWRLPPRAPLLTLLSLPALALAVGITGAAGTGLSTGSGVQRNAGSTRGSGIDHVTGLRQQWTVCRGHSAAGSGSVGSTGGSTRGRASEPLGSVATVRLRRVLLQESQASEGAVSVHSDSENLHTGEERGSGPGFGEGHTAGIPGSGIERKGLSSVEIRRRLACFGTQGKWRWRGQPRRLPWNVQGLEHCDLQWVKSNKYHLAGPSADSLRDPASWNVRETLKFRWTPDPDCGEWMDFRKSWFCSALDNLGGSMLLVGDSVTRNMLHSLHNHLSMGDGQGGRRRPNLLFKPALCKHWESSGRMEARMKLCSCMTPCAGRHRVCHVRNDWLTLNATHFADVSVGFFVPWRSLVKSWDIKAVLLNRGAHFQPSEQFSAGLEETVGTLRRENPDLLIMYRGSSAGHADCDSYQKPLQEPQSGPLPFHWSEILEQNALARRIVEQHGGVYLNVETMTALRADGHFGTYNGKVDCLHYCSPGPVDEWVGLLYNAMVQLL